MSDAKLAEFDIKMAAADTCGCWKGKEQVIGRLLNREAALMLQNRELQDQVDILTARNKRLREIVEGEK